MEILDGKKISKEIFDECKKKISDNKLNICMHAILVGDDSGSLIYFNNQKKKCEDAGIKFVPHNLPIGTKENDLIDLINQLNNDKNANGIFVHLPLPKNINKDKIINSINPIKDVDGYSVYSSGKLFSGVKGLRPCTPTGIIELIKRYNINLDGKNVVIIGRSNIVGKPMAMLFLEENSTVTICHSHTKDLKNICKNADILVVAIKKPKYIDDTYVKKGAIVIDAGINMVDGKICGDVDFDKVSQYASYITPVPGGVGAMTSVMLIKNLINTVSE